MLQARDTSLETFDCSPARVPGRKLFLSRAAAHIHDLYDFSFHLPETKPLLSSGMKSFSKRSFAYFSCSLHSSMRFALPLALALAAKAEGEAKITHSFLVTGAETKIVGANGEVLWNYPHSTRDGWVLPDGHLLLTLSADKKDFPGGGVVEATRDGKVLFEYQGTQSEVNTAQL